MGVPGVRRQGPALRDTVQSRRGALGRLPGESTEALAPHRLRCGSQGPEPQENGPATLGQVAPTAPSDARRAGGALVGVQGGRWQGQLYTPQCTDQEH